MYEIRPETIKSFIEDNNIKLPRFQRKQTWDDKKNFQLCISIFKEFPIGVSILNIEKNDGVTTRWLLDGRQRRNALMQFYKDPENIYIWAKKFIGFKANDQPLDLEEKFWGKINEYLEEDNEEENKEGSNEENEENEEDNNSTEMILDENDEIDSEEIEETKTKNKSNIDLLLYIIKLTHNKNKKYSGFTRPFDFSKEIPNLSYLVNEEGVSKLSSQKLKTFIIEYKNYSSNENLQYKEKESFIEFIKYRFSIDPIKIRAKIEQNWDNIFERIEILDKIDNLYMNSKIGLIEVKDLKSVDAQKIFNIINSEGTKLSAVEILSAKPSWNAVINNPSTTQIEYTKKLYRKIQIDSVKFDNVVKWDLPATFISRLTHKNFFFKNFTNSNTDLSKEITLGFKFLAGNKEYGVKKEDIDKLGKNRDLRWDIDHETVIQEINTVTQLILKHNYFKYLNSWNFSIIENLSDAISLNFLLLMYKDWKRKDCPIGNDNKMKIFQKNAFILFDNLIFEYVTKQWRGSSDSKIARNILSIDKENDLFKPLEKQKWEILLSDIFEKNVIDDDQITQIIMQPLLYHFYALSNIQGPDTNYSIEIDHIIPQSIFKSSAIKNKEIVNNLFNLALLPKDENISKSNKMLSQINSPWLEDQIEKYEFIEKKDFMKYSDLTNIDDLKLMRSSKIYDAFDKKRDQILVN